jgi:folate-dependent phosphoribosylglycinamide formyltransferase PurN
LAERCRQLEINGLYTRKLLKNIVDSFSGGIMDFYPSLLPRHRGINPSF